jgi:hypothetical protein
LLLVILGQLLQLLTLKNGELSWKNNNTLELKDINKIKKQKPVYLGYFLKLPAY